MINAVNKVIYGQQTAKIFASFNKLHYPYFKPANTLKRSVGFTKLPKGSMAQNRGGDPDLRKYNLAFRENSDTLYTARKCNFFAFM